VGNAFELTDLGENDLKGIAQPVHGWRVERALETESRFDANRGGGALTPIGGSTTGSRMHIEPARIKSTADTIKALYDAAAPLAAGAAALWAAFGHTLF
jgi:hypothetical protein